jgi:hypothetical protein
MFQRMRKTLRGTLPLAILLAPLCAAAVAAQNPAAPFRALIVGGGPDPQDNAAQIEGHSRYVEELLPPSATRRVLFADGMPKNKSVSYADPGAEAEARDALSILLANDQLSSTPLLRAPDVGGAIDGRSSKEAIHGAITALLSPRDEKAPFLLYFAGHGAPQGPHEENIYYDLWDGKPLSVRDLSTEIARLPEDAPVTVVMAQCFSGAFANLLFADGNPKGKPAPQNLAGFFAARKDREAAGCGWETGEEDYQDFSSYFFGALCGYNRFGHPVKGADVDGDGVVTLHEAFCYALGHDDSVDTPVCTSDIFLRRFAPMPEAKIYATPYSEVWQAGSAAQRAALDTLSGQLGLSGEQRALAAQDRLKFSDPQGQPAQLAASRGTIDTLNALRQKTLATLLKDWPALRWSRSRAYSEAVEGAVKALQKNPSLCGELMAAEKARDLAGGIIENDEARLWRFADLYGSIVRAKSLREHGNAETKARFERLWAAEQRSLPLSFPRR